MLWVPYGTVPYDMTPIALAVESLGPAPDDFLAVEPIRE